MPSEFPGQILAGDINFLLRVRCRAAGPHAFDAAHRKAPPLSAACSIANSLRCAGSCTEGSAALRHAPGRQARAAAPPVRGRAAEARSALSAHRVRRWTGAAAQASGLSCPDAPAAECSQPPVRLHFDPPLFRFRRGPSRVSGFPAGAGCSEKNRPEKPACCKENLFDDKSVSRGHLR